MKTDALLASMLIHLARPIGCSEEYLLMNSKGTLYKARYTCSRCFNSGNFGRMTHRVSSMLSDISERKGSCMTHTQARNWQIEVLRGILAILFSMLWLLLRKGVIQAVLLVLGIFLIMDGMLELMRLLRRQPQMRYPWGDVMLCGASILLGVISITNPILTLFLVLLILAMRLILRGIAQWHEARRGTAPAPGWLWLYGLVLIVSGVLLVAIPRVTLNVVLWVIPLYAFVDGTIILLRGVLLKIVPARMVMAPIQPSGPFGALPEDALTARRGIVFVRRAGANGLGHIAWAFEWTNGWFNTGSVENLMGKAIARPEAMDFWSMHTLDPIQAVQSQVHPYDECKIFFVLHPHPKQAWRAVIWTSRTPYSVVRHNCMDVAYDILRTFGVRTLVDPAAEYVPNDWFDALPGPSYALLPNAPIALQLHRMSQHPLPTTSIVLHIPAHVPAEPPAWRVGTRRIWSIVMQTWEKMVQDVRALGSFPEKRTSL
jgi:uncharacterized membrane protein HdeD (DUF308 family)